MRFFLEESVRIFSTKNVVKFGIQMAPTAGCNRFLVRHGLKGAKGVTKLLLTVALCASFIYYVSRSGDSSIGVWKRPTDAAKLAHGPAAQGVYCNVLVVTVRLTSEKVAIDKLPKSISGICYRTKTHWGNFLDVKTFGHPKKYLQCVS